MDILYEITYTFENDEKQLSKEQQDLLGDKLNELGDYVLPLQKKKRSAKRFFSMNLH